MLWKCCTRYASIFGKLSSGHRTGRDQFSLQSQRKAIAKKCSNYHTISFISNTTKIMHKILQARLQQYMNCERPDVQVGFREGRGIRDQLPTSIGSLKKQESSRKTSTSGLLTMPKSLTMWITTNCGKFLKQMGITDHLTCLLRNLYAGQEATVRTRHGTTDWFQIGRGVHQGCRLSPCLFSLNAEYIMKNAGLDESQAGIKIAGRNININNPNM